MNKEKVIEALKQVIAAVKEAAEADPVENCRFKVLSDGWVFDKALGIEWGPSSGKCMNFSEAEKYAFDKGGRLPSVKELRSLIDYDRIEPAIDTQFFKDTKTGDWYWTGTTVASNSDRAWCVGFFNGSVGFYNKVFDNYVRPVRPSQCLTI
jgi:hypothetical protein